MLRTFDGDIIYNVCGLEVWKLLWVVLRGILVLDFDPTLHLNLIGWLEHILPFFPSCFGGGDCRLVG